MRRKIFSSFNKRITDFATKSGIETQSLRMFDCIQPSYGDFSHLIISGSEASATEEYPWYDYLSDIIKTSIEKGKRVLGICYGHQFLARCLMGSDTVRANHSPEFGWVEIKIYDNEIFKEINDPVFMVSHFDEVNHLKDGFSLLASSQRCGIQAFQMNNKPVWGIQFHPEYNVKDAKDIFKMLERKNPDFINFYEEREINDEILAEREKLFANFFKNSDKNCFD